ncbi:HpcH/HpaI aldolase/citrate lyase family protein [Colwellia sp. MEBiC06753]
MSTKTCHSSPTSNVVKLLRSILFVPGSRSERFAKAQTSGADLCCIDLEDAVLPENKQSARQAVLDYLNNVSRDVCVRINGLDSELGQQDLTLITKANPAYIMLAKCHRPEHIKIAAAAMGENTKIIALIESIEGVEQAYQIATASNKVVALMFGGADVAAQLRCQFSFQPLLFVRSQLVMAAAKANIDLIDVPYIDFHDTDGLLAETSQVSELGFTGKAAIHPKQVAIIHQGFQPSSQQIAEAKAILSAVNSEDAGVVVVAGKMIDKPVIVAAQRILKISQAAT